MIFYDLEQMRKKNIKIQIILRVISNTYSFNLKVSCAFVFSLCVKKILNFILIFSNLKKSKMSKLTRIKTLL